MPKPSVMVTINVKLGFLRQSLIPYPASRQSSAIFSNKFHPRFSECSATQAPEISVQFNLLTVCRITEKCFRFSQDTVSGLGLNESQDRTAPRAPASAICRFRTRWRHEYNLAHAVQGSLLSTDCRWFDHPNISSLEAFAGCSRQSISPTLRRG